MEIFGIRFSPFNVPLERRLQTLAVFWMYSSIPFYAALGIGLTVYILFYTKFWMCAVAYLSWIWIIDKDTPKLGGRKIKLLTSFKYLNYARDYFPANLRIDNKAVFDPKRNYLFCVFPHGVLPIGSYLTLITNTCKFNEIAPQHKVYAVTLDCNFKVPLLRDMLLFTGACSSSAKSISNLLSRPKGGIMVGLAVGGAEECFYARPGSYQVVLKNRKGFVKLALKNGSPLVPVFSFGETDVYDQVCFEKGTLLRTCQEWIKLKTGLTPMIFIGRGFFQYSFGLLPRRTPLNVVVGAPIEVQKIDEPSQNDVDRLHSIFTEELKNIFDTYKHKYLKNPKEAELIIC